MSKETRSEELLRRLDEIGGHVTLFKFSSGWKIVHGTPHIEGFDDGGDYDAISNIGEHHDTLIDALESFFRHPQGVPSLPISTDADRAVVNERTARAKC